MYCAILHADGRRWTKEYEITDYLQGLNNFILNDKLLIDDIIKSEIKNYKSEDPFNVLGFIRNQDFVKWQENVLKFREEKGYRKLNFALMRFVVKGFQPIKECRFERLPANTQFIFLVGDNGSGKSTLLKSIAIALGNKFFDRNYSNNEDRRFLIDMQVKINGKRKRVRVTDDEPQQTELKSIPFAAYGASRLQVYQYPYVEKENRSKQDRTHGLYNLFYVDGLLLDFNRWVSNEISVTMGKRRFGSNAELTLRKENIIELLISIIPNVVRIADMRIDGHVIAELGFIEEDEEGARSVLPLQYSELSSGIKSLIAMLGDMLVRLFQQQPKVTDPSQLEGIVIIDEIDIHLHPKWQKALPNLLAMKFPFIQFIVSTHSPIPLLGMPENSTIYHISRNIKEGVKLKALDYLNVANLLPNTILTSPIFGMDSLSSTSADGIESINVDDDFDDTRFFNTLDKKMDELAKKQKKSDRKYLD